ncbi:VCBS repeat-containing protein [Snuella lapsa]|uniref:VCBS repeat-containing protein n=2 Tax=Snuella lapsa TaxID=870481 RepID=A0ABP6Y8Q8_9FLAO
MLSCRDNVVMKPNATAPVSETLFTQLSALQTGIDFVNEIPESSVMNSMVYEYFYNGGGVAIGDINNDGLQDVYFTSNLKENRLYLNKGRFKFEDVTEKAKVKGSFGWTTGVTMVDINADGWLDIYVCKSGKGKAENRQNELFINNKNASFTEAAKDYGLNFSGYSTQAAFFDFDKDGDLDMFLLNHNVSPVSTNNPEDYKMREDDMVGDKLYRNDNGKFIDISKQAGIIENALGFGLGVSIGDLNQDGWPDIYVANDYIEQDYLYYNNGDGTFKESLKTSVGHVSNFSMGTDIADINNDGMLDVMTLDMVAEDNYGIKTSMSGMNPKVFNHAVNNGFHYQYMYNTLQLNAGQEKFSDVAQMAGVSNTDWSWAPLFADFDNDGFKDLFVSNGLKRDFRNNDFRKYKLKRLEQAHKNGEKLAVVIEELVKKTPQRKTKNYFFKNKGELTFTKKSEAWGVTDATFSNGAAYADLDNDGDLDLVINNIDEAATVLRNNSNKNYLQFKLNGSAKNPYGIGARVEIRFEGKQQVIENYVTRGYQSAVQPWVHFGLGDVEQVDTVMVTWTDGKTQVLDHVKANHIMSLNYQDATDKSYRDEKIVSPHFKNVTEVSKVDYVHIENDYDDFEKESLLPHKMSQFGPALAVGDINKDGLEDFYVGGAKGHTAALYIQKENGAFEISNTAIWKQDSSFEDIAAVFFDADNDADLDLYVVSGGNEWPEKHAMYQDRLYINNKGVFKKENVRLPKIESSGSCVKPFDYDGDGDLDLFVGSRLLPQKYPYPGKSYLLQNNAGHFKDVTREVIPEVEYLGLVTDAVWVDFDNDAQKELVVVGEWMPITVFKQQSGTFRIQKDVFANTNGWWNCIKEADLDNDGDMDFVVGNLGLNYKYKASPEAPFEVFSKDFDANGTNDIVLGYYNQGDLFPLRGRECSSNQMPFIKEKFPTYDSFGSARLIEVYGDKHLEDALHLKAFAFASVCLENLGNGRFKTRNLPNQVQISSINDMYIKDVDGDSLKDIVVVGNLYHSEVETPRNDASFGHLLKNNGQFGFTAIPALESGILIDGQVNVIQPVKGVSKEKVILARNNKSLQVIESND